MTLDEFMTERGMSNAALAAALQTDRWQVYRYRKGARRPRAEMMTRIHEVTGGAVSYGDWYAPVNEIPPAAPATSEPAPGESSNAAA